MGRFCIMLTVLSICAGAGNVLADEWTRRDTAIQAFSIALRVVDWSQTRYIAKHPEKYYERVNWILPEHPSTKQVDLYFASAIIGEAVITYFLPRPWREVFQGIQIGSSSSCVMMNFRIGIGGGDWF